MPYPFTLIIPAAGSGQRMGMDVPKPFLSIAGRSVLERTLDLFEGLPGLRHVVIATSPGLLGQVRKFLSQHSFSTDLQVVEGGGSRQESVFRALLEVRCDDCLVVVHDAVRPFTDRGQILHCLEQANECGAAILAVPVNDTIKEVGSDRFISATPDRARLWRAQTPQIFRKALLLRAHSEASKKNFEGTDDASLVEWLGEPVAVVEGSVTNIKLTYPLDLKLAEFIVKQEQEEEEVK